jgi:iron complex outermembrane receptor protein
VNGVIFDPETSRSIELGMKLTLLGGALNGTLALYQLTKDNVLATDTNNPGYSLAIGKARSRGIEFDLTGRLPGGVELLVSYAYTDAEARSSMLDPNYSFQISPGSADQHSQAQPQHAGGEDFRHWRARGAGGGRDAVSRQAIG